MNTIAQPFTESELAGQTNQSSGRINQSPTAQDKIILTLVNLPSTVVLVGGDETPGWYYSTNVMPTNGVLSALDTNSGSITYTPSNSFAGKDFFNFIVHEVDGSLTATGKVSVGVMASDASICFNVLANTIIQVATIPAKSTLCVTHIPSQPDDGCVSVGGASPSYITVTNLVNSSLCSTLSDYVNCSYEDNITNASMLLSPTNFGLPVVVVDNTFRWTLTTNSLLSSSGPNADSYGYCNIPANKSLKLSGIVTYIYDPLSAGTQVCLIRVTAPFSTNVIFFNTSSHTNEPFTVTVPLNNYTNNIVSFSWYFKNDPEVVFPLVRGKMQFDVLMTNSIIP